VSKILLPINPEYAEQIINGKKRFEFRRRIAKQNVDTIVIYCTNPIKKVLGEVRVRSVLSDTPKNLWNRTKPYAGITKKDFDHYFKDTSIAYAYELEEVQVFDIPKELIDYGIKYAPQSFIYLNE
jgi:predicted transcriptional regulator